MAFKWHTNTPAFMASCVWAWVNLAQPVYKDRCVRLNKTAASWASRNEDQRSAFRVFVTNAPRSFVIAHDHILYFAQERPFPGSWAYRTNNGRKTAYGAILPGLGAALPLPPPNYNPITSFLLFY